ncbi:MAG: RDD family protein [Nitrospiraceae bacterium]|nr:RDD family protein [Nitrospiraceae bacterium]
MNDTAIQPDNEQEKKRNRNLAIGVGVLGLGLFGLTYVLFFAVMILRPGLMFKLMPVPSVTDAAVSDGKNVYLLSQKMDMSTMNPRERRQPEMKRYLAVLQGSKPGSSQEIPSYEHASGRDGRLVFLSQGGYRIYDGNKWTEERSESIGEDPHGLITSAGLYVLSTFENGPRLVLFGTGAAAAPVPLPDAYVAASKKDDACSCAKLAWYQNHLCLFWTEDGSIAWSILNGTTWSAPATSPYSGGYEVLSDGKNLYFFHRQGEGKNKTLTYYVYTNDAWSGPMHLAIQGGFTNWDVFLQQGKVRLFTQQFTSQNLYTIQKETLVEPVRLAGSTSAFPVMMPVLVIFTASNLLPILVIFGFSALINRFKKRIWIEGDRTYEFATVFRRFLATTIDGIVLVIPPIAAVILLFPKPEEMAGNPFRFLFLFFFALALFMIGGYLYYSLLEGFFGQTLGKLICRIRVLNEDFSPCTLSAAFLRNLLRIIDGFFYFLVAVVALCGTFKWQRIGDLVADTVVVRDRH